MKRWIWALLLAFPFAAHAVTCNQWAVGTDSASGETQLVAARTGQSVYVCSLALTTASTSAVTAQLQYGTGTACATGTASLSLLVPLQASSTIPFVWFALPLGENVNWQTPLSNAVCLNLGAAQTVYYQINYAVQ